jgi:uncharacterized protein (TIGR00255 family)
VIKSMTGFAAVRREDDRAVLGISIRAVNHRFLDLQMRVPPVLAAVEPDLRALVATHVARGRVELAVSLQLRLPPSVDVEFNEPLATALGQAIDRARDAGLVAGALTPGDLLRLPQAVTIRERQSEADDTVLAGVGAAVREATAEALAELDVMRLREGEHVRADLDRRRALAAELIERLAVAADQGRAALEERLRARVRELRAELQADDTAVAQEIVRAAARSDISEEVARFRGHLAHWVTLADSAEPCGRKLDFLLQEMNREVNTIGSKADGLRVSELVIAVKAELEKMREQAQNVE